jgi:formylglycine-generating enzyme required for sulfatase activity
MRAPASRYDAFVIVRCLTAVAAATAAGCGGGAYEPVMVDVPAGAFAMGCNASVDTRCEADELPTHDVTIAAFAIDRDEVSQAVFAGCVDDGACTPPNGDYDPDARGAFPVTFVTWDQAAAFCAWAGQRLPTEAEWERAARGDDGRIYPWGNAAPDCALANLFACGDATQPVGGHPAGASPFGALDMAGNVMEWVADFYAADYYTTSPAVDPTGPATGNERVKRGGSYMGDADTVRVTNRVIGFPVGVPNLGFRCARSQ